MPNYRRWRVEGGMVFLTVVVHERHPLFIGGQARKVLRTAIAETRRELPFQLTAICLMPDHLHCVLQLPESDSDYSTRIQLVKTKFSHRWLELGGWEGNVSQSRRSKGERGVWQRRFWEHTIRDEQDLEHCVDYIHWNPRKHKLVHRIRDYPFSSFHRFVQLGQYEIEWGNVDPCGDWADAEFVRE